MAYKLPGLALLLDAMRQEDEQEFRLQAQTAEQAFRDTQAERDRALQTALANLQQEGYADMRALEERLKLAQIASDEERDRLNRLSHEKIAGMNAMMDQLRLEGKRVTGAETMGGDAELTLIHSQIDRMVGLPSEEREALKRKALTIFTTEASEAHMSRVLQSFGRQMAAAKERSDEAIPGMSITASRNLAPIFGGKENERVIGNILGHLDTEAATRFEGGGRGVNWIESLFNPPTGATERELAYKKTGVIPTISSGERLKGVIGKDINQFDWMMRKAEKDAAGLVPLLQEAVKNPAVLGTGTLKTLADTFSKIGVAAAGLSESGAWSLLNDRGEPRFPNLSELFRHVGSLSMLEEGAAMAGTSRLWMETMTKQQAKLQAEQAYK